MRLRTREALFPRFVVREALARHVRFDACLAKSHYKFTTNATTGAVHAWVFKHLRPMPPACFRRDAGG